MTDSAILTQSNSAIKRQARIDNANQKNFGGKLDNFDDNRDRHFHQRMLKAYLRGATEFPFGFNPIPNIYTGRKDPLYHAVLLTDKSVDAGKVDKLLAEGYCDPGKVFGGSSNNKGGLRKLLRKRLSDKAKAVKDKSKEKGFLSKFGM